MRKLIFTLLVLLSFIGSGFAQNVIEPELQNILNQKGNEMINVNIILKSQMDISKLRSRAEKITDKEVRRDILVNELKLFAEKEQQDILSILRAEEKSDRVSDIDPRWMTNYINCTVSADVIYLLSEHPDVMIIGYNQEKKLLWNEKSEKAEASRGTICENITMVNADDVWAMGYTGYGIIVAVIDTGVNYNHIDLADHLWQGGPEFPHHGYDIYYNTNDPMDKFGHGTHCAGTVCGDGSSGTTTGVAPDATLMCVKALSDDGEGTVNHINSGMEWAIEHQADILSMSLGIPMSTTSERTILRRTCVTALELGVVAAVACGNEGEMTWMNPIPNNVRVPGSCPPPWLHPEQADNNPGELSCVVSVGAVDFNNNAASFSSVGPVTWQETEFNDYAYQPGIGLIRPDVCAPGVNIVSLDYASNDGFATMSGTSMACPAVAGTMALIMERNKDITPAEISMILETTAYKITDNKNNKTGSGRIDALAAIEAIKLGNFTYISHFIDDEDNGNGNANLNALEQVNLHITFQNESDETYNNIKAVLRTDNILVRIDDSIAQINSIGANEPISITEGFQFLVDETADYNTTIGFDVFFYDENDELFSFFRIPIEVMDNDLQYASAVIDMDDNENGILEAGETANFIVVINNIGNELALGINGILSCDDDDISINISEASFNSVGPGTSAAATFNVTLSEDASEVYSIPFELSLVDIYNNERHMTFDFANACNVIFELSDSYGDGWDGAALIVKYSDGTPDEAFTVTNGYSKTYTRQIKSGVEVTLEWNKGSWDLECSFIIKTENGNVIYTNGGFLSNGFLFSWINDCAKLNEYVIMCEPVINLHQVESSSDIELAWEEPETGIVSYYEIYRNERLIATTEEPGFIEENTKESSSYLYSVRPVYEDCYGTFECVMVEVTDAVSESDIVEVEIYPNPSQNDFNIICNEMSRVTVFNVTGSMIIDAQINNGIFTISGLKAGVYFVNIETSHGNIVKKIVKVAS